MFSKSKTPAAKGQVVRTQVTPSLISHGLSISGDLKCDGEIQVDGAVVGDIDCQRLIVGEKATVHGEIIAEVVIVRGEVKGRVCGREVSLASTARVNGDILHQSLAMEAGAHLEGQVRKIDDPRAPVPNVIPTLLQTKGGPVRTVETKLNGGPREVAGDTAAGA